MKERRKSAGVEMADMAAAGSSALPPGGQSAAVREDAALRNASPQVPAGSSRPLLSGLTAVAALAAVHTL